MNKRLIASSTLASALAFAIGQAQAADAPAQEKCFGVAKAGQNDCASATHSCASQGKTDNAADDWKMVPKGTCTKLGGKPAGEEKPAPGK